MELIDRLATYQYTDIDFVKEDFNNDLLALKDCFGSNKSLDPNYELPFLLALSFYPSLRQTKIKLRSQRLKTSMAVRPSIRALVGARQRHYWLFVDDVSDKAIDFRRAPFSAQVGCFIHELAHVLHYEKQSALRLAKEGVLYLSSQSFRSQYEKMTDTLAAQQGGGYYVFQYADFIFNQAGADPAYIDYKRNNYFDDKSLYQLFLRYKK